MTPIRTHGLTKRFDDDIVAVDSLDLTVEEGEIFGFLGPNGAGKSTTINVLLNFLTPSEGTAEVLGMDTQREAAAIRNRIGVLPEGYGFDQYLTGREYIEWTIETKAADDDPDEILNTVGISDNADRPATGYSKGMKQRLAFGIALVGNPEVLILDEPSTGLDPNGIQQIRSVIREQAATGTTVFFSSHILPEVEAVCDRVGVMNDGQLVAVDTIENLRTEVSSQASVELQCAEQPPVEAVRTLDIVNEATVNETTLTVRCIKPAAKVDVIRYVDNRVSVVDVFADDTSLEELFNQYTDDNRGVLSEEDVTNDSQGASS